MDAGFVDPTIAAPTAGSETAVGLTGNAEVPAEFWADEEPARKAQAPNTSHRLLWFIGVGIFNLVVLRSECRPVALAMSRYPKF
jgi:hypothetical protein